jgi:7,8-dihydro-6-hydroxymethylpterin dimethyltransferase
MRTLGITHSVCSACRTLVPARVVADDKGVFFRKFCPVHGESECFVRSAPADYLRTQRYVKPAWIPRSFAADAHAPCPNGCGICERHEQHLCMPIIEITSRCDLACPVCLVDAGRAWDMTLEEFRRILNALLNAEGQIDVLNLSGGEPLLHPQLLELIDEATSRPEIIRVSVSTNGLRLLDSPQLLRALVQRQVTISLQFDGFDDRAYELLRGRPLVAEKRRILELLERENASASLTMTAARGVNDDQFPAMLEYLFAHEHVLSLMVQPVAFAGRGAGLAGRIGRLTIPDVVRALGAAGHQAVSSDDFIPLPCSHPLCFSLAFYLMTGSGQPVSVSRVVQARDLLDVVGNRIFCGLTPEEHDYMKDLIYRLWSGPSAAAPDTQAVIAVVRDLLRQTACCRLEPRKVFTAAERRIKSIFIHAFQDADTFDLARVRRCCNAYPQPDGHMIPACVHNVLRRRRKED